MRGDGWPFQWCQNWDVLQLSPALPALSTYLAPLQALQVPPLVQGSLGGEWIKKSLNLTSSVAANDLVIGWTACGQIGVVKPDVPLLKEAVDTFVEDARAQQLNWETVRKHEAFLERRLLSWCESKGYRLKQPPAVLADFRRTWDDSPLYAVKNIERQRSFFRFCQRMKWVSENPALAINPPKVRAKPTLPFTAAEMNRILAACDSYRGDQARVKAFVLLMSYSRPASGRCDCAQARRDEREEAPAVHAQDRTAGLRSDA